MKLTTLKLTAKQRRTLESMCTAVGMDDLDWQFRDNGRGAFAVALYAPIGFVFSNTGRRVSVALGNATGDYPAVLPTTRVVVFSKFAQVRDHVVAELATLTRAS